MFFNACERLIYFFVSIESTERLYQATITKYIIQTMLVAGAVQNLPELNPPQLLLL